MLDFVDRDILPSENQKWGGVLRDIVQSRLLEFIEGGDTETFSSLLTSQKMSPPLLVALLKQSGVVGDRRKLLARYKQVLAHSNLFG